VTRRLSGPALPASALGLAGIALAGLAGCSSLSDTLSPAKVDYRTAAVKTATLEVPPDLTQLTNDPRYQPPTGSVISANALQSAAPAAATAPVGNTSGTVAPQRMGEVYIERAGNQRWLVSPLPADQLWPVLRAFWLEQGFTLVGEQAETGLMDTDWMENRAKIPQDIIRRTIGKAFSGLYDAGERDRYHTRIERSANGTEVYISHRGAIEVYTDERKDQTAWQLRPSDPSLEAEMLSRLMLKLGGAPVASTAAAGKSPALAAAPAAEVVRAARARVVEGGNGTSLRVDDSFDRSWRRVGSVLDRTGFTVEDRDRSQGVYYVRYVDPKLAGKEDPSFFARLFGAKKNEAAAGERLRVQILGEGPSSSLVSVLDAEGAAPKSDSARNIVQLLVAELR
jgi:outer membrane protein assembly factor BamC